MNKGDRNVAVSVNLRNSYSKVRVELGFFQASCLCMFNHSFK